MSLLYCTRRYPALSNGSLAFRHAFQSFDTKRRRAAAPARRAAHGRPSHGGSARRRSLRLRCGGMGRLDRGRARATGGLEQRLAGPRLGGAPAPVGPKLRPSRSAHRPASARQAAAQRGVVEEGAVLRVVVGHESAPMARRACSAYRGRNRSPSRVPVRVRGDPGRRSVAGVTRGRRAPVCAANGSPRWSAVPGGSRWTAQRLGGRQSRNLSESPRMDHPPNESL